MARTGQFSHYTNGSPQSRAGKYGFRGGVRENIAMGASTVDSAFNMWQNSGAHYASIVSGTAEAGFGYAVGPGGQVYWVGMYGTPPAGDVVGETEAEVVEAMRDLRAVNCDLLTLGQYLQPTLHQRPVVEFVRPEQFEAYGELARALGFTHVASGPMVRSSYHADDFKLPAV